MQYGAFVAPFYLPMFTTHPEFELPDNDAVLWRYLDLPRYLDLLIKEQLFFPCASILEDPFEGMYRVNRQAFAAQGNPTLVISSWHHNTEENYAMWKIYAQGSAGLAIQTTFEHLKNSFHKTDKPVWIGKVKYYEEDHPPAMEHRLYAPFLHKRSVFAFENEVRCCYKPDAADNDYSWEEQDLLSGVFIPVDLSVLIDRIYISPYAPQWFRELVAGINKRFHIDKEIVHSGILDRGK